MTKLLQILIAIVILGMTFCLGLLYAECVANGQMFKFVFVSGFSSLVVFIPALTALYFTIKE